MLHSLDSWIGNRSINLFNKYNIHENYDNLTKEVLKSKGKDNYLSFSLTPDDIDEQTVFYLPNQDIGFDAAMTFGLGVVKVSSGDYKGLYMLYNHSPMQDEDLKVENKMDELLMLKL